MANSVRLVGVPFIEIWFPLSLELDFQWIRSCEIFMVLWGHS